LQRHIVTSRDRKGDLIATITEETAPVRKQIITSRDAQGDLFAELIEDVAA